MIKLRTIPFDLPCGHQVRFPNKASRGMHGYPYFCPVCGEEYRVWVFTCGHAFPAELNWENLSAWVINNPGKCDDCEYRPHKPIRGHCYICGKAMLLTVGDEMVCDDCLPEAFIKSLSNIAAKAEMAQFEN